MPPRSFAQRRIDEIREQQKVTSAACNTELQLFIGLSVAAIAKLKAEETGTTSGEFPCPACRSGTVRWSVAPNGHIRAYCPRKCDDGGSCVNVME